MSDDIHATDLAEGPYRDATAAAIRGLLDVLEAAWRGNAGGEDDDVVAARGAHMGKPGGLRGGAIYVGECGAAMLLYKLAMIQRSIAPGEPAVGVAGGGAGGGGSHLFGRSTEVLLREALGRCKAGLRAMRTDDADESSSRITFLEGEAGGHALMAAILAAMGKMDAAAASVERLVAMTPRVLALPSSECELLYGRCGFLHALLFAKKRVGGYIADALLPPAAFTGVIAQVIAEGARGAAKVLEEDASSSAVEAVEAGRVRPRTWGLMYEWHGKRYLGCCHGLAGVVLTLLQCEAVLGWAPGQCWETSEDDAHVDGTPATARVRDAIAGLTSCLFEDGNLPSSTTSSAGNKLVQWCHGAPGLLPLLAAAMSHPGPSVAPPRVYQQPMSRAAEATWQRGLLSKGPGLCHGAAGNGYGFLSVYRCTRDPRALARARRFAQWTAKHAAKLTERADRPASLFEGAAGAAAFLADTLDPDRSWFPGCEP